MKKYLFGMLAIALAVGFTAFTTIEKASKAKFTTTYWRYTLTTGGADQLDPGNYAAFADQTAFSTFNCPTPVAITCKFQFNGTTLPNPLPNVNGNSDDIPNSSDISNLTKKQ